MGAGMRGGKKGKHKYPKNRKSPVDHKVKGHWRGKAKGGKTYIKGFKKGE